MTSHALHVEHKVLNQNFFFEPRLCLLRPETLNPQIHPRFWIAGVADLASAAECDHLGGANTSLSPRAMQLLQVEEHDRISLKIAKPPIPTRFLLRMRFRTATSLLHVFRLQHQGHLVHGPCNRSYSKSNAAANENMHVVCRSITRVRCKRTSKPRPPSQPSTTHTRLIGYIQNPGDMKLRPGTTDHFSGVVRAGRLLDILCRSRVEAVRSRSLARRHVGDGFYWPPIYLVQQALAV